MATNRPCPSCSTPLPAEARFCLNCGLDVTDPSGSSATLLTDASAAHLEEMLQKETRGEFEIERELGRGGMAVVFLARETLLDRRVAIKVLPPELTFGRGATDRFRREAQMAARLDHPNIIPIYRVSSEGQLFWYSMKWIEGDTLQDLLEQKSPLDLDEAVEILEQIADALDYAHGRNIIHRDMKPSNVLLDGSGRVTVTDFGIAKPLGATSMTLSGVMMGTPQFMAPEQCTGGEVTGASDQYALGVMSHQMLSGRLLFEAESPIEVLHKHCYVEPTRLGTLRPDLPQCVGRAVHRALGKEPSERFPTVTDFVAELRGEREREDLTSLGIQDSIIRIDSGVGLPSPLLEPSSKTRSTSAGPPQPAARLRFVVPLGIVIAALIITVFAPRAAPGDGQESSTPREMSTPSGEDAEAMPIHRGTDSRPTEAEVRAYLDSTSEPEAAIGGPSSEPLADGVAVAAGGQISCALNRSGEAHCWGSGQSGQLGNGSRVDSRFPVRVLGGHRWVAIDAEQALACALSESNDLYCWGDGHSGQLGNGADSSSSRPVRVLGDVEWVSFDVGLHSCGISEAGDAYCWGSSAYGSLGDGTSRTTAIPVKIPSREMEALAWQQISTSTQHTCGIADEGRAYCWGWNRYGQLGHGDRSEDRWLPALVVHDQSQENDRTESTWVRIKAGLGHTCGILSSQEAYCWGQGEHGALGHGSTDDASYPTRVLGGLAWSVIDAGAGITCGVTANGELYCWGQWLGSDQLTGSPYDRFQAREDAQTWIRPERWSEDRNWSSVDVGDHHACGLTVEGHVYCWGWDGVTNLSLEPRRITIRGVQAGDPP